MSARPGKAVHESEDVRWWAPGPRGFRPPDDPTYPAVGRARAKPVRVPAGPRAPQALRRRAPPGSQLPRRMSRRRPGFRRTRPTTGTGAAAREDREVEPWLGASGGGPKPAPPPRRRPPVPRARPGDEATTVIAAERPEDPELTEKLNTGEKEKKKEERRRGGGLSAQDLLRREGRPQARTLHTRLRRFREHASWALASDTLEFGDRRRHCWCFRRATALAAPGLQPFRPLSAGTTELSKEL